MATILLVDDHADIREGFARFLRQSGYTVLTAGDFASAQRLLLEDRPHLLITDVRLDAYNGLQLIAMAPQPIPAIVVTGYADPSIESDARRLGAEYYVKPFAPAKCLEVVGRLLAREPLRVLTNARATPRRKVALPLPVRIGPYLGRLVDVSEAGMRLEVHAAAELGLASTMTVNIGSVALAVHVKWHRRQGERTWSCGATVAPEDDADWRTLLASLS